MKIKKIISSKTLLLLLTAAALVFTACGSKEVQKEESVVSLLKDGSVASYVKQDFKQDYYDKDELQQRILTDVASYNKEAKEPAISVEKVSVGNNVVTVEMTYAKASDYAAFNGGEFFVGTPREAKEAGYNLNVVLVGAKNEQETVGMSDILAMEKEKLLITDRIETVHLNGKAMYKSEGVTVTKDQKTVILEEEPEEVAIIIFQ